MRRAVALVVVAACNGAPATPVDDDAARPPDAAREVPRLSRSGQICKLLSDRNVADPTPNAVQLRSNVLGADLGIPVAVGGALYVLFGDTIGFAGIWGGGESHPDAVGYALDPAAAVAADPSLLCTRLRIVSLAPGASTGPQVDPRVEADFAGAAMVAPAGHALAEYIHNPAGTGAGFANLPGDFEVPSGAFAAGGALYALYTTVVSRSDIEMKGSYLARWDAPSPAAVPAYQILYAIDQRFDAAGPLRGDFINIAAEVSGEQLYLFGTGRYRTSPVHLARKPLGALATPGGFERYDAATGGWVAPAAAAAPIVDVAGHGETSVRYFPAIDRWMFLAEELLPGSNRIVARFADRPEGPWSAAIVVHDMADPAFRAAYCCAAANACDGMQFFDCARTGFYGTYLFPDVRRTATGFTVTYTMSSFDPYNVALFEATFED
jgi:hypothetical protein